MSKPSAAAGRTNKGRGARRERRTPLQQALIWSVIGVISYGLTLTLVSDTFFWFAIPGVLGLLTVVIIAISAVLREVPWTDDVKGIVKCYALFVLIAAAMIALPWVTGIRYLYPFMGIGMMVLFAGPKLLNDHKRGS